MLSLDEARAAAAAVLDPELPVLSIADLGILRDVAMADDGSVVVTITPTYSGCPAMDVIRRDVEDAVRAAGFDRVEVRTVLSPAWTTDWLTESGRAGPAGLRHRAPFPAYDVDWTCCPVAVGALPAVRQPGHPRVQPVRLDGVQVALGVQRLPRAVRPHEGDLTVTTDLTATTTVVDTGRRHGTFHPLRVGAVEPLTDDAVAITFEVPDDLRADYVFDAGQHLTAAHRGRWQRGAPQLLDLRLRAQRPAADRREAAGRRRLLRPCDLDASRSVTWST